MTVPFQFRGHERPTRTALHSVQTDPPNRWPAFPCLVLNCLPLVRGGAHGVVGSHIPVFPLSPQNSVGA